MRAGVIFTFMIICAVIAWMDIQKRQIYNEAVAVLFVPAIVSFFVFPEMSVVSRFWGAVSVSGIMLLIDLVHPGAFGGGDIKMMVPIGLFLGLERTLVSGVIALASQGILCFIILLKGICVNRQKKSTVKDIVRGIFRIRLPFAPALCLGSIAALLWGEHIRHWLAYISFGGHIMKG